jgi:hypothetical protein
MALPTSRDRHGIPRQIRGHAVLGKGELFPHHLSLTSTAVKVHVGLDALQSTFVREQVNDPRLPATLRAAR